MIKKIRNSLTAKIFLITSVLLILSSLVTYSFIAYFMPKTFSNDLNEQLTQQSLELTDKLGKTTLKDCGPLIDSFMITNLAEVSLLDENNIPVKLPTTVSSKAESRNENWTINISDMPKVNQNGSKADAVVSKADAASKEYTFSNAVFVSMSTAQDYPVTFVGSGKQYTLMITSNTKAVNQVTAALGHIMPWLVAVVLLISLLGALIYSRYVTQPIVKISRISAKMSQLEFDSYCEIERTDEIGLLANSLNELSQKLSTTLTELQKANSTLQEDFDRERELELKRLDFFSAVSHELKTPITVIKGQLEGMLYKVGNYRDRDRYLARSLTVTKTLEAMVQDILTISRMESSKFILQSKALDFSKLVRTQLMDYAELIEQKGLSLQEDVDDDIFINVDWALLEKAIGNLISNAAHYSGRGGTVYVEVHRTEQKVKFSILNTIAHIPEELLPQLFEAFYRVEKSRNRQTGGSGLGLYIVKRILDQHNAQYKIENIEAGVKFTFILERVGS